MNSITTNTTILEQREKSLYNPKAFLIWAFDHKMVSSKFIYFLNMLYTHDERWWNGYRKKINICWLVEVRDQRPWATIVVCHSLIFWILIMFRNITVAPCVGKSLSEWIFQNVRTIISLTICSLECMFLGGTLIAWAPLLYTFLDDGVFKDRCVYNNITQVSKSILGILFIHWYFEYRWDAVNSKYQKSTNFFK